MTERDAHSQDPLPIAALLRMAADAELDAEQEARLRAHLAEHPEDAGRVEFERRLRRACARACAPEATAPDALRRRILAAAADPRAGDDLPAKLAARTRDRSFWSRPLARLGAVAALLVLAVTVAFMFTRGGPLDPRPLTPQVVFDRVVHFVRSEHDRCAGLPAHDRIKFVIADPAEVEPQFASLAGRAVSLDTISEAEAHGLHFVDAGPCHLPSGGTAMHIRFRTDDPSGAVVSVWAQVDGTLQLDEGVTYVDNGEDASVRLWRVGEVRYIMVSCSDRALAEAQEAMACPAQHRVPGEI